MKKILLLVIAFLPVFGFGQALSGDYIIGTSQAAPFNTLENAITKINTVGVSGPVRFLIDNNQTITTPYSINSLSGSSAVNTFTISPNVGKTITIAANNPNGWTVVKAVFKLDDAKNIFFDGSNNNTTTQNITIINNCNIEYGSDRTVMWMTGSIDNVVFKNLKVVQSKYNSDSAFSGGVYLGGNSVATNSPSNKNSDKIEISNVKFEGVKQAVYINNNNGHTTSNLKIYNNRFGDNSVEGKMHKGIYLNNVNAFEIYKNEIRDVNSSFTADHYVGVYVNGNNGSLYNNIIYNIKRSSADQSIVGIWLVSNLNQNTDVGVKAYNNFITDVQTPGTNGSYTQGAYGIYLQDGNGFKVYHNTINLKQNFQTSGLSAALIVEKGKNLDVRNNIFNNNLTYNGPGRASIAIVNYTTDTFSKLDYNNYFSNGVIGIKEGITNISYANPGYIQTLANWKTALGKDTFSKNVQPAFINENNDLHLVPGNIINVQELGGVTGLGIVEDIDQEERYTPRPTMGADEIEETRCGGVVTWNGTSWSPSKPTNWTGDESLKIIIAGPYTLGDASLLKSCQLEIVTDAVLTIGNGSTYIVEDKLTLNDGSTMVVQDNGSFVQVREPDQNVIHPNSVFQVYRKTQPMYRYDFTYWSSPVEGYKLREVSPTTLFDKFYSWNADNQEWTAHKSNLAEAQLERMGTGKGYIVRAPQSYSTNPTVRTKWEAKFTGKPNNGVKEIAVTNGSEEQWNLIGNPYPSAIHVNTFMTTNSGVLEGAIYLWTHTSAITQSSTGSQIYTYSASDYMTVNATGKVAAGPADNSLDVDNGDDFKIASGQSFFVKGKVTGATGTQVVFNNAMRVKESGANNQFFKPGPTEPVDNWETTGKHRVWLNLTGDSNAFNQAMVGYVENATNELDGAYDADVFSGGTVSLYSLLETKKLTIQGRALPFNNQDEVPLGYKTTLTGTLKIAIDHFDGLFNGQDIYLEDKVLNIVHNLKDAEYTFTTVPGTFNDRFVLRYVPAAELGTDNPTVDANSMVIFRNGSQINIKSNDQTIEHVTVYDLLGKVIFDKGNINAQSFSTSQLNVSNQVVIVKVITDTQAEVVKKVIMN